MSGGKRGTSSSLDADLQANRHLWTAVALQDHLVSSLNLNLSLGRPARTHRVPPLRRRGRGRTTGTTGTRARTEPRSRYSPQRSSSMQFTGESSDSRSSQQQLNRSASEHTATLTTPTTTTTTTSTRSPNSRNSTRNSRGRPGGVSSGRSVRGRSGVGDLGRDIGRGGGGGGGGSSRGVRMRGEGVGGIVGVNGHARDSTTAATTATATNYGGSRGSNARPNYNAEYRISRTTNSRDRSARSNLRGGHTTHHTRTARGGNSSVGVRGGVRGGVGGGVRGGVGRQRVTRREGVALVDPSTSSDEDEPAPKLSLAQKMGLVDAPPTRLTREEWSQIAATAEERNASADPCPICKEDFGKDKQVLLSCSHVFHKDCLESFERYSGTVCCPLCRAQNYQKKTTKEGERVYRRKCAVTIQKVWRGYKERVKYEEYRRHNPPNDPQLRQQWYARKLGELTDGVLAEVDNEGDELDRLFATFDRSVALQSEAISQLGLPEPDPPPPQRQPAPTPHRHAHNDSHSLGGGVSCAGGSGVGEREGEGERPTLSNAQWEAAQAKAFERRFTDCAICLVAFDEEYKRGEPPRPTVLLSCSHVFHAACLMSFESFCVDEHPVCPLCRSEYTKLRVAVGEVERFGD